MPRPAAAARRRLPGLPVCLSLLVHVVGLGVLAVLLADRGAASEPDVVRAQLRIDVDSEVQPRREVVPAEPPTPDAETRALDAPLRNPVDVLPDQLPELPSEPPVQDEDLLVEPSVEPPERVPLLPVHEIPLDAVKARPPVPPRAAPRAEPVPAPPVVRPRPAPKPARLPLRIVHQPDPSRWYPEAARIRGIEGTTMVRILVDDRGLVVDARVARSSGSDLLDRQALRVGFAYRFAPGAAGPADLPVRFRLE